MNLLQNSTPFKHINWTSKSSLILYAEIALFVIAFGYLIIFVYIVYSFYNFLFIYF